jgi:hypothetical protein
LTGHGESLRAVLRPTDVRRASIRRFSWVSDGAHPPCLSHGEFHPAPAGRLGGVTVHRAVTTGGSAAWLYRGPSEEIEHFLARQRSARRLAGVIGAGLPGVLDVDDRGVWIERHERSVLGWPAAMRAIDAYVAAAISTPILDGAVVATGRPGLVPGGEVLVEDASVLRRLEFDERVLIRDIVSGLLEGEVRTVVHAVDDLCGVRPSDLTDVASRCVLSLRGARTSLGLGLGLHLLAVVAAGGGPRSEPLVLIADELLHRLDFAHAFRCDVPSLLETPTVDRAGSGVHARRRGQVA